MFSRPKIADSSAAPSTVGSAAVGVPGGGGSETGTGAAGSGPKVKPSPSLLSSDLVIKGDVSTTGDVQIEGMIEGDVRAHLLTVGESATIRGEVVADDVVVNGRVIGRLRGIKVRLTATAKVEGDIVHKSIAIESGAHFEGSVHRSEDPLADKQRPERAALPPAELADTGGER